MPKKGLRVCNIVNAQEAQSGHKFTKTPRFFFCGLVAKKFAENLTHLYLISFINLFF